MITRNGIEVKFERFTPTKAKEILAENTNGHNRKLSERQVLRMVTSWDQGEFIDTGDTIKFDKQGLLIDGQHRLASVAKQGKPRWFLVARGLKPEAIRVVDLTGKPRTWGDALQIEGHKNTTKLAAVLRGTVQWEMNGYPTHASLVPSFQEAMEHLERRPGILEETMPFVLSLINEMGNVLTVKEMGSVFEVIRVANPSEARMFMEEIATGQVVVKTPAYVAYHQIRKAKADPRLHVSYSWTAAVLVLAWNDTINGVKSRTKGYLPKEGPSNFPNAVGFEKWLANE